VAEPTGVEAPVDDAGAEGVALGELEGDNVPSEYTSETPAETGQTATRRPVTTGQAGGLGRRKEAIARVRLVPGTGQWKINGRPLDAYFPNKVHQQIVSEPFVTLGAEGQFDVVALITGGGVTGQAGALRLGVARALILIDAENRPALKKAGFLTRDPRVKERKKYGLKKARKAPQYSKR
jgi:small subunit ribosomal protein S9